MTTLSLPKHIAIVMDGNGRWAKKRFLSRISGHRAGVDIARRIVKHCVKRNIEVLSLFAFSSENWSRPENEVNYLMELFFTALENKFIQTLHEHHIQLRFIGDRTRFNTKLLSKIIEVEHLTCANKGMVLMIAVDYGGQWDICQAVRNMLQDVLSNRLSVEEITPEQISHRLSFADLPNPDLFIRTSGEIRISNFMLWQLAYAELYFTDTLWPDFDEQALDEALVHFSRRERRYGQSSAHSDNSLVRG
jgi:undecaprenyl diphosphate synthase